jgi:hypothetical protein
MPDAMQPDAMQPDHEGRPSPCVPICAGAPMALKYPLKIGEVASSNDLS